ncbi:MAG: hypothetical protein ACM359_06225, partial [Bacillota bacterium]
MAQGDDSAQVEQQLGSLQLALLPSGQWSLAGGLFLHDRPGELAEVSATIAGNGGNIELFAYNRSEDANLVTMAAAMSTAESAGRLADALRAQGHLQPPSQGKEKAEITDL